MPARAPPPADAGCCLRLRPLPAARRCAGRSSAPPVLLLFVRALSEVYLRLVPVPTRQPRPLRSLPRTPGGRLALALLAVGVAPVLEEFFFRGLIQRTLERRWGPAAGICLAAAAFALVHALPWIFPLHFFLGLAFGFAVFATRSIWAGVAPARRQQRRRLPGHALPPPPTPTPTLWQAGPTADAGAASSSCSSAPLPPSSLAIWCARGSDARRRHKTL